MDEDDEYSLHYEFLDQITKADKHSVASLTKNVLQRGNPFNLEQPKRVMNIATDAILEKDKEDFLMNCISLEKDARNDSMSHVWQRKTNSCWKLFLKLEKAPRKRVRKKNIIWLKKRFTLYWLCSLGRFRSWNSHGLWNLTYILLSYKKRFDSKAK